MRLDHLLSKEHFLPACFGLVRGQYIGECPVLVAHGWNVDYSALLVGWLLVLLRRGTRLAGWGCRACCWVSEGTAVGCVLGAGPSELARWCGVVGGWLLFENCTVDASICGQVFKGARWMPWHQEPMKDVGGRDRPRGVVNRAVIRGCPNGGTRQSSWAVTCR